MKMRKSTLALWILVSMGVVIVSGCAAVVVPTPPPDRDATVEAAVAATLTAQSAPQPTATLTSQPTPEPTTMPTPIQQIFLEAEDGTGGEDKLRSEASNQETRWLNTDEILTIPFDLATSARYKLDVVTSNDHVNGAPLETVYVQLDGEEIGHFSPADTGDNGFGWNIFVTNYCIAPVEILAGGHSLTFYVTEGDGFGVEIDVAILKPAG